MQLSSQWIIILSKLLYVSLHDNTNPVGTIQCNLDLVTLNLVTTCDLVTILQRPFFNLLHKIIRFSDIVQFSDSFCGDQKCH